MLDLKSLNDAQQKAVMHGSGPLLVLAGPGSGKTYTITQHIFYLIEREHVPPEKILVITFTKDAALSMQNRFRELSMQTLPVNFGTFHSVFYHILKESHVVSTQKILTDAQKKNLLSRILKNFIQKEEMADRENDFTEDVAAILSVIGYYKNTGNLTDAENRLTEEWRPRFRAVLEAYERQRMQSRAIDFDDMVTECRRYLVQDESVRRYWQGRFSHILIDEFQDINPVQYEVIRLLSAPPHNLFAVGDDDQSVYGFRGSGPDCLKRFTEDYQADKICLEINYRSRKEIIEASHLVIQENRNRFWKNLKASPEREKLLWNLEQTVRIRSFAEREEENRYLLEELRNNTQSVAVLFRTNSYMRSFAAILNREGIFFSMREKTASIYEHFIVKDIMAYILLANGKESRELFLRIMNKPSRYISREALREEEPYFQGILRYYGRASENVYRTGSEKGVIGTVKQWEKQMERLRGMSPYLAVQYVRKVIGYENYLKEKAGRKPEKWQEWEELLNFLGEDASHYDSIWDWNDAHNKEHTDQNTAKNQRTGNQNAGRNTDRQDRGKRISLMTVHASKGLEFDKVYIPDCNEKIFPHGSMPDQETCEEERRLFYVAMTRAKESLELLYLTGTKERPRLPSRFLNQLFLMYGHSSTSSSNSQLSRYSSKASATFSYSSSSSMKSSSGSSLGSSGFSR